LDAKKLDDIYPIHFDNKTKVCTFVALKLPCCKSIFRDKKIKNVKKMYNKGKEKLEKSMNIEKILFGLRKVKIL
jgi:hypothetical protein